MAAWLLTRVVAGAGQTDQTGAGALLYSPDACDCAWAKADACGGTGDGSICWPHCCRGFMQQNSVPRGSDRPGEDETRHDDLSLDQPSFATEEGGYREGAARLVTALQKTGHGPSVTIYCRRRLDDAASGCVVLANAATRSRRRDICSAGHLGWQCPSTGLGEDRAGRLPSRKSCLS